MSSRELVAVLRAMRDLNIVGADVVEVAPSYDQAEVTAVAGRTWPTNWSALWSTHDRIALADGKTAAAAFTFDVDAESAVLWGNEAVGARMSVMSHQAYGRWSASRASSTYWSAIRSRRPSSCRAPPPTAIRRPSAPSSPPDTRSPTTGTCTSSRRH
jgi:hypothetical protein